MARHSRSRERRRDVSPAARAALDELLANDDPTGRLRPSNKYLPWELRTHPLGVPEWSAEAFLPEIERTLAGDPDAIRRAFAIVEREARAWDVAHDICGDVVDSWSRPTRPLHRRVIPTRLPPREPGAATDDGRMLNTSLRSFPNRGGVPRTSVPALWCVSAPQANRGRRPRGASSPAANASSLHRVCGQHAWGDGALGALGRWSPPKHDDLERLVAPIQLAGPRLCATRSGNSPLSLGEVAEPRDHLSGRTVVSRAQGTHTQMVWNRCSTRNGWLHDRDSWHARLMIANLDA